MNTTTTKIAGEAMQITNEQIDAIAEQTFSKHAGRVFGTQWCRDFARALLASKPAIIGASDRTEIFSSNLQRTREQWEKCDPEAMSKMSQAAVFHALNDAKRDVLMMHALLAAPQQPAQSAEQDERAAFLSGRDVEELFLRWSEWTTELGEAISRKNIDGFVSDLRALPAAQPVSGGKS
jgi:hypothetical protein